MKISASRTLLILTTWTKTKINKKARNLRKTRRKATRTGCDGKHCLHRTPGSDVAGSKIG